MARRSTPQKKIDDRDFPVRMKILVPAYGFGLDYFEIKQWLLRELGPEGFAWHGAGRVRDRDALGVYVRRPEHAARFLEAFPAIELADCNRPSRLEASTDR